MENTFPQGYLVKFLSADNYTLEGFLKHSKKNVDHRALMILHIHGLHSGWSSSTGLSLFDLKENVFLINTRGAEMASSIKNTKKQYLTVGSAFERFEDCVNDIFGAMEFLKSQGYKKIILSGHSTGCQKIIFNQLEKKNKEIVGLILLAPADDLNLNKKMFGSLFSKKLKAAKSINYLAPQPEEFNLLSGKRFWEQNKPSSIEGNLFNYTKELTHLSKITLPILSIFGREEQYAIIKPQLMLDKIKAHAKHPASEAHLISGDHSFSGFHTELTCHIQKWITKIKSYNN